MRQLGMFAKYWQPGKVKTRLARHVGDRQASDLYRAFLRTLVRRFEASADRRILAYWPEDRRDQFRALAGGNWSVELQTSGDLGQRMSRFFAAARACAGGPIVLIGSDSPTLPVQYVERAFELLEHVPVVLGPSTDGGYYLIGISGPIPCLFSGVSWSTPQVLDQTVALLHQADCRYALLPPWYDVDDGDDLRKLGGELDAMRPLDDALRDLREIVDGVLGNE